MNPVNMREKERTTSWLAMKLGCCASGQDGDDEREEAWRAHDETDMRMCYEQPQIVPQPLAEPTQVRPSTSHSMSRHVSQWVSNSRDYATRASSRASISTLTRPRRSQSRPIISRPMDFRHVDGPEGLQSMLDETSMPVHRRRSFRPLELSIYLPTGCGRLSPLPDFEDEDGWSNNPTELGVPAEALVRVRDSRTNSLTSNFSTSSYSIQRKPVVASPSRRSSVQSEQSTGTHERHLSGTTMATMATPTLALLPEETTSRGSPVNEQPTLQRSRTSGALSPGRVTSRIPSPSRTRSNTAPSRPNSLRRTHTDVEDAIRELNTIVEERRASAYYLHTYSPALINRLPPSPSHHVPYIAPTMRMRVRSETLSDIGSAFSAPLARKAPTSRPSATIPRPSNLKLFPKTRSQTGPFAASPDSPVPAPICRSISTSASSTHTTPISRLSAWIKRSASSVTLSSGPRPPIHTRNKPTSSHKTESIPFSRRRSSTPTHTRHKSNDSNATTSTYETLLPPPSPPSSTSSARSASASVSPAPLAPLSTPRKPKRVPAPLTLAQEKEVAIEADVGIDDVLPSLHSACSLDVEKHGLAHVETGVVGVAF